MHVVKCNTKAAMKVLKEGVPRSNFLIKMEKLQIQKDDFDYPD